MDKKSLDRENVAEDKKSLKQLKYVDIYVYYTIQIQDQKGGSQIYK